MWTILFGKIFEISQLDTENYIRLVATYNVTTDKSHSVSDEVKRRGYTPEQIKAVEAQFASKFSPVESCGLLFTKPFSHLKFEPFNHVMALFDYFESGFLPFEGGLSSQPSQIMEIFAVLKQLKHERTIKLQEQQSANNVRNKHQNHIGGRGRRSTKGTK